MTKKLPKEVLEYFQQQGREGGKIGGKKSLETMTPEARVARAKVASEAARAARNAKKAQSNAKA